MAKNIVKQSSRVSLERRAELLGHPGCVVWLTGLPGSGKSTIAFALEKALIDANRFAFVLDGDNVRHGLCSDLGFTADDRAENIRRIGELAALFGQSGAIAITAFISPYRVGRIAARKAATDAGIRFEEVYLDVPVEVCESRDPKGHYKRARAGEIQDFTGVSAPYEIPAEPRLRLNTHELDVDACVEKICALVAG